MKRKILSIVLVLSMLCAFMPVVSSAAASDVSKLVNYIIKAGDVVGVGNYSIQESEVQNGYNITSSITYHSSSNMIEFEFTMEKKSSNMLCQVGFYYDVLAQKAENNIIHALYAKGYPLSNTNRTADFDISRYTTKTILNFQPRNTDINPPSNTSELFNDMAQSGVSSWALMCLNKAGVRIDKIGFTSYPGGSTTEPTPKPTPTPTPAPTPTPTPKVQYYPETNIPTYTYITNQALLGVDNNVYCYTYNSSKFNSYINTLKASYDFYEYYKKSSSELILYYLTNDKYSLLVGYSPTKNMVAVSFDTSLPTTTATVTKSETETAYIFDVSPEAAYGNCCVYAALYNANGFLLTANCTPLETTNDTIISLDKKPEAEVAKVFIWAKTTLQPIITAVEIPIND